MADKEEKENKNAGEGCCKEDWDKMKWKKRCHFHHHHGGNGCFYGLGFIGAAIYFIGQNPTFGAVVVGLLKAFVWPAYLAFYALKFFVH